MQTVGFNQLGVVDGSHYSHATGLKPVAPCGWVRQSRCKLQCEFVERTNGLRQNNSLSSPTRFQSTVRIGCTHQVAPNMTFLSRFLNTGLCSLTCGSVPVVILISFKVRF